MVTLIDLNSWGRALVREVAQELMLLTLNCEGSKLIRAETANFLMAKLAQAPT